MTNSQILLLFIVSILLLDALILLLEACTIFIMNMRANKEQKKLNDSIIEITALSLHTICVKAENNQISKNTAIEKILSLVNDLNSVEINQVFDLTEKCLLKSKKDYFIIIKNIVMMTKDNS